MPELAHIDLKDEALPIPGRVRGEVRKKSIGGKMRATGTVRCPLCDWKVEIIQVPVEDVLLRSLHAPETVKWEVESEPGSDPEVFVTNHLGTHLLGEWVEKIYKLEDELVIQRQQRNWAIELLRFVKRNLPAQWNEIEQADTDGRWLNAY